VLKSKQRGFTLLEVAIVCVIIGLLFASVLKGQELIHSSRVRALASMQDGVKAAFFGFQDRFRAYPGDYSRATLDIDGATVNGDGNGQIEVAGAGTAAREDIAVWEHLSRAGFMSGSYTYNSTPSAATSLTNSFGSPVQLAYDNAYADAGAPSIKNNLKTGSGVAADLMAELDRKIDDGNPQTGNFRFSPYTAGGAAPAAASCHTAGAWNLTGSVESNCGGATLF
jgi:prepilin-type N-terminal cleavage/methylation domain-containing protein